MFKLTPEGVLTPLYSYKPPTTVSSLVYAKDGNLYGTSNNDGSCSSEAPPSYGCGTVFQLTPQATYTVLYTFSDTSDGFNPFNLVQYADGNFYGLTSGSMPSPGLVGAGGSMGTVFEITPGGALTTLLTFSALNGAYPASLLQAANGNFYGTTSYGGTGPCQYKDSYANQLVDGCGTVFEISPGGSYSVLYSFQAAADGSGPAKLVQGADGNLYGITGGTNISNSYGTFFKITPSGAFTTVSDFQGADALPNALVSATNGNFYGTSLYGGAGTCAAAPTHPAGCGTIFELTSAGSLMVLSSFAGTSVESGVISLLQGSDGNLYGTSGSGEGSTVFEFTLPAPDPPAISASGGVLNGASFQPGISPGSWITISGTNLATQPDSWTIVNGALPTTLDGVSVSVGGQPAYIEYISATQINALAPNVPAGIVPVIVTNFNGAGRAVDAQLAAETPAFFQWGTYAVATHQDYTYAVKNGTFAGTTTVPAAPGDVIILWGTGFGPTSPSVPAGVETPSTTTYNTVTPVSVTVGGKSATVYGAALASGYAGLYQIAIQIPAGLANGDYVVTATINGVSSPSTTMITVQQ